MSVPVSMLITAMLKAFNRESDGMTVAAYMEAIKDCDQDASRKAIAEILTNSKFCPVPAELRQSICEQSSESSWKKGYSDHELQAIREWEKGAETYHEALERVLQRHGIYEERGPGFVATGDVAVRPKITFQPIP